MTRWISRSEHARRLDITPAAVTKHARSAPDDSLRGDDIDADHPYWVDHAERKFRPRAKKPAPRKLERPEDYLDLTIREIAERFETDPHAPVAFREYVDIQKKLEDTRKTRLDNDETERELIRRQLVATHVFGAQEGLHRRLLGDAIRTMAARSSAAAKSGQDLHEIETMMREVVMRLLEPVRMRFEKILQPDD